MKLKLDDSISSPQDLRSLILEVRDYANWFSHNNIKKRVHAKHPSEQPAMSPAGVALIRETITKTPLSQKSLDELIAQLEDYEATAPQLTITLAAPASSGLKKTLVAWSRQNIADSMLVSFEFNSTLLGGLVVRYGSRIFDWSFRQQILEARGRFPEILRNV